MTPTTPDTQDREAAEKYAVEKLPNFYIGETRRKIRNALIEAFKAGIQHGCAAERARCAEIAEFPLREKWTGYTGQSVENETARRIAKRIRAGGEPEGKE